MEIRTFGGGGRLSECEKMLRERLVGDRFDRLILLPIPTAKDEKYITGTAISPIEILPMLNSRTAVVGYNLPHDIRREAEIVGAEVYDAAEDENFLLANAELTARGTVGYMLTVLRRDPGELSVGVVGYGRIGMRLVRWLLLLGSRITVYTTRREMVLRLCEAGVSASLVGEADLSGIDLLVNTAPARQIELSSVPPCAEVIDLASGSSFDPSDRVIKLPSVPDKMYPLTAGRLYAEGALKKLGGIG